jgi:phosphoglycerate kinase
MRRPLALSVDGGMIFMMQSIRDAKVKNKKVLVRLDLDVPVTNGEVGELTRIESGLATLQFLLDNGASPVVLSHAGRPGGEVDESLSLRPMLAKLTELLGGKFTYEIIDRPMPNLEDTIFALENLRFHSGEEANDPEFARYLASFGDLYVNESFAVSHRAHASFVGVGSLLPAYAGIHLMEEVERLESTMKSPAHPVVVVLGGAKVETKMPAITNMSSIADMILIGGKLAAEAKDVALPENVRVAELTEDGFDVSESSAREFAEQIVVAKTIIWNGPLGKFEEPPYDAGTKVVAEAVAANKQANRVIGGGDTIAAIDSFGLLDQVGYVSTGGGAMLDFLAGEELPGLKVLGYYN